MRTTWRGSYTLLFLVLQLVGRTEAGAAQIPSLTDIFAKIEDVNTGIGMVRSVGTSDLDGDRMRSIIFEVTFVVKGPPPEGSATTYDVTERVVTQTGADSVVELHYVPKKPDASSTQVEIGLSYGQVTGFRGEAAGFEVTGAFEEFPVIATYVTFSEGELLEPYLAARAGISKLSGFRAYDASDSLYTATGNTYLVGLGAGIGLRVQRGIYLYLEGTANYRHFPSVEWGAVGGVVPASLPRTLRISTFDLMAGVQLGIK